MLTLHGIEFNPVLGDVEGNAAGITSYIQKFDAADTLLMFSELALVGYLPDDLLFTKSFQKRVETQLEKIFSKVEKGGLLIGAPFYQNAAAAKKVDFNTEFGRQSSQYQPVSRCIFNSVFFVERTKLKARIDKTLLPSYDVFDERRYFLPGRQAAQERIICFEETKCLVLVCEDIWFEEIQQKIADGEAIASSYGQGENPLAEFNSPTNAFDVILVLSASPFTKNRLHERLRLCETLVRRLQKPLFYLNQVGANDELIFDGRSFFLEPYSKSKSKKTTTRLSFLSKGFKERDFKLLLKPLPAAKNMSYASHGYEKHRLSLYVENKLNEKKQNMAGAASLLASNFSSDVFLDASKNRAENMAENMAEDLSEDLSEDFSRLFEEEASVEALTKALCFGIQDYAKKTGFSKALLGLSGGIDSAVTFVLGVLALGKDNVTALAMPSPYSSKGSVDDALALTKNLGMPLQIISIHKPFFELKNLMQSVFGEALHSLTEENLQPRLRANILMAYSNQWGHMLLSTGNKSELAMGYTTLYGDLSGALSVIGDVLKTEVYQLARFLNKLVYKSGKDGNLEGFLEGNLGLIGKAREAEHRPIIPLSIIEKAPSAELKLQQKDSDTLPPYDVLDGILDLLLVERLSLAEMVHAGYEQSVVKEVMKRVKASEYKRFQAPPVLKVSEKAFGRGRRIPIARLPKKSKE